MERKPLLQSLLLLLGISYLLLSVAVPLTGSLMLENLDPIAVEMMEVEEQMNIRKMLEIESNDYTGSGANNRHDPKTPGSG